MASWKKALFLAVALVLFFAAGCEKDSPLPQNKAEEAKAEQTAGSGKSEAAGGKAAGDMKEKDPATGKAPDAGEKRGTGSAGKPAEKGGKTSVSDNPEKSGAETEKKAAPQAKNRSGQSASTSDKETGSGGATPASRPGPAVTVSVIGLDDHGKTKVFLPPSKIGIGSKDTVFTATIRILKEKNIPYEASGSGASAYMEGIHGLYEFDYGPLSGWLYKKNGVIVNRGAGSEPVKNGDEIVWFYTKDFTKN